MPVPLPPLPPQSAITVRSDPHCLTLSWAGRRGIIRRVLALPGRSVTLLLYRDRLVSSEWPRGAPSCIVPVVSSRGFQSTGIPREALGDVRLEGSDEAVRLTVKYGVASRVEIGASLGESDKAWLAEVLRRWIAG